MPAVERQENNTKEERELVSWIAPERPFKRRSRDFYVTVIAMAAVAGLVLFLVEGFMPVILIISLVFLFYVMSTVEPQNIAYAITNKGIKIAGQTTPWELMNRFWFARRFDSELLVVEIMRIPGRLEMVITPEMKSKIEEELKKNLVHEEVSPSFLDKSANWVTRRLPGN